MERDKKVPRLLSDIGPKTYATLKNLTAPGLPADCDLQTLKEHLVQHFKPQSIIIAERFQFHKRDQHPDETINEFMIELRKLAHSCDFGAFLDQALWDHFVCELANTSLVHSKQLKDLFLMSFSTPCSTFGVYRSITLMYHIAPKWKCIQLLL